MCMHLQPIIPYITFFEKIISVGALCLNVQGAVFYSLIFFKMENHSVPGCDRFLIHHNVYIFICKFSIIVSKYELF